MDDFCDVMKREIEVVVGSHIPEAEAWIFSENNYPLGKSLSLNAKELAEKSPEELLRILSKISSNTASVDLTSEDAPQNTSYGKTGYQRLG